MRGTDKEPVGSVSVCGPASEGQSSILDESVQETVCENALDYARDVYKFSFNPPLASIQESRDETMAKLRSCGPRCAERERLKHRLRDELQAEFKDALKEAHEEAVPKALAAFEFATRDVGCAKQEYKRHLEEFMRNEYEGFEDSQCKMALERASAVYKSALKYPQSHTKTTTVKEPIGSVLVRRSARIANDQSVQETDCQKALDQAKDVYKSSFKPPLTMLTEAGNKAMDAYKAVAVGAGGPGSIRRQYKKILRDIMCKEYEDAVRKTHEEAVANALLAFESEVGGAVASVKETYKRPLEDFMKNEYEGYQEAEIRRMLQVLNFTHLLPSVLESLRSAKRQ